MLAIHLFSGFDHKNEDIGIILVQRGQIKTSYQQTGERQIYIAPQ